MTGGKVTVRQSWDCAVHGLLNARYGAGIFEWVFFVEKTAYSQNTLPSANQRRSKVIQKVSLVIHNSVEAGDFRYVCSQSERESGKGPLPLCSLPSYIYTALRSVAFMHL